MDVKAKLSNDDNFPSLKDKIGTSGSTCSWLLLITSTGYTHMKKGQ